MNMVGFGARFMNRGVAGNRPASAPVQPGFQTQGASVTRSARTAPLAPRGPAKASPRTEVIYLELVNIEAIHAGVLRRGGGNPGWLGGDVGRGRMASALYRPQSYATYQQAGVSMQAAVLFHAIVKAHAFVDGNKRTAIAATQTFLARNGYELVATNTELMAFALRCENQAWTENNVHMYLGRKIRARAPIAASQTRSLGRTT